MVVKALSDPNHDREMEVKIDGSHFVTLSISRNYMDLHMDVHVLLCGFPWKYSSILIRLFLSNH